MKKFDVILRKANIWLDIVIKSIPVRLFGRAKNDLVLHSNNPGTYAEKSIYEIDNRIALDSKCGTVSKLVSECISETSYLGSRVKEVFAIKYAELRNSTVNLSSNVMTLLIVTYNKLADLDGDVQNDGFILSKYDSMSLKDVDFVVVEEGGE